MRIVDDELGMLEGKPRKPQPLLYDMFLFLQAGHISVATIFPAQVPTLSALLQWSFHATRICSGLLVKSPPLRYIHSRILGLLYSLSSIPVCRSFHTLPSPTQYLPSMTLEGVGALSLARSHKRSFLLIHGIVCLLKKK